MIPVDVAFAQCVNRTAMAYQSQAPPYMSYRERTHIVVSGAGRGQQDIDRRILVRVADNVAVMQDLTAGAPRTGQAFQIIAYFSPLSDVGFRYYVNLRRRDIDLDRTSPYFFGLPKADPDVDATIYYNPYFHPIYAA